MKLWLSGLCLGLCLSLGGMHRDALAESETLVTGYNEAEMDAAIARARAQTTEFLQVLEQADADSFSVKAPISDANGTEHIWIENVRLVEGEFVGTVANEPGIVQHVVLGQSWRVKQSEISDWMYVRGERIHGGYTIDPLLDSWDPQQAQALRKQLVR